jgi:cytochrome oxidase Cu insertion factor (SCO1/SenC/PrrC family)
MFNPSDRLRALLRGAIVFTALALAGVVFLYLVVLNRNTSALPVLFEVPEFALTNQHGLVVTRSNLLGHVWVADIIFTRCAGPCPTMTRRMSELQAALPLEQSVRLVTLTTDPTHDTPEVLKSYAAKFGAEPHRWFFLTGTKAQIVNLAADGLKLTAVEKESGQRTTPEDLFIHSTIFILVDQRGRVRGTFESDQPGVNGKVLESIRVLQRER